MNSLPNLKEDDEFEEFDEEDWNEDQEDPVDSTLWMSNWDDDDMDDQFTRDLRAELLKEQTSL